jgi:hypothetical protein
MRTILSIGLKNEMKTQLTVWRFLSKIWNLLVALITIKTNCMKLKTKRLEYSKQKIYLTSVGNCQRTLIFELRILETNHHITI